MTKYISRGKSIEPVYLNNIFVAAKGWGVVSGLTVSQKSSGADMSVDVAAGSAYISGTNLSKGSTTNISITAADSTYDRYDLIVINSSGTISVIDGTADEISYANDYDLDGNNAILLAEVYVHASDTSITDSQITNMSIAREDTTPTGSWIPYGGSTAPTGYLLCDGSAVSRTTYAALYTVIGTTFGVGDGSTTFNVPDMRGRVTVGIGGSGVTSLGDTGGEQEHTLTVDEMPAHKHSINIDSAEVGAVQQNIGINNEDGTGSTGTTGGGDAHNNMQPYLGGNYIIKT